MAVNTEIKPEEVVKAFLYSPVVVWSKKNANKKTPRYGRGARYPSREKASERSRRERANPRARTSREAERFDSLPPRRPYSERSCPAGFRERPLAVCSRPYRTRRAALRLCSDKRVASESTRKA